jgi:AcrR family transcriptional regulator
MAEQPRRELILEVADRLLRHYGPQKTTMADVAREANVGVGSVYLEFPSKDALVQALSQRHYRGILASMRFAAEESGARSSADRLVRVLEARAVGFLALVEAGAHACDLLHCGNEAVQAAHQAYGDEERAIFTQVLKEGARSGELDIVDVDVTLRTLLLAYAAFAPPWIFKIDQKRFGSDISAMHGLILNGLLRRTGGKKRAP